MSVILTESAAITKSSGINGFNGDSMNLNGRAISVQDADNGSKAAGVVKPPYVCAVTSYSAKGAASGAASAFNDYSYSIFENRKNALPLVKKYFDDMDIVSSGFGKDVFSAGILCITERSVVAAVKGNSEILRYSENKLTTLEAPDDDIGFNTYTDLHNGDYYVILGAKCAKTADKKVITEILSEAPDVKLALQRIFRSVYATCKHNDCTILVVRIKTDYAPDNQDGGSDTYSGLDPLSLEFGQNEDAKKKIGAVSMGALKPVKSEANQNPGNKPVSDQVRAEEKTEKDIRPAAYTPASDTEAAEESAASDSFDFYFEDIDDDDFEEETKSVGKKLLGLLPFAVLIILIAIIAVMFLFPKDDGENPNKPADVSSLDSIRMTTTKKAKPTKTAETETTTAEAETTTAVNEENDQTTAPVTEAPETQPPTRPTTTNPPTTNPPTTNPPTTQPPTTEPPTTQPPTTEPPTTQPPTTEPPTTQPPETTRLTDIPDQRD